MKRVRRQRAQLVGRLKRQITRLRHRRGHGVHSPYIYNIVREVFMCRTKESTISPLYSTLMALGMSSRSAREVENLRHHCGFSTFGVDTLEPLDMVVCSPSTPRETIEDIVESARACGTTVVIPAPYLNLKRGEMCDNIIAHHRSTTINRVGYLVIFNNHLPKQHFIL